MVRLLREKVWNGHRKFMKIASIARDKGLGPLRSCRSPFPTSSVYPCIHSLCNARLRLIWCLIWLLTPTLLDDKWNFIEYYGLIEFERHYTGSKRYETCIRWQKALWWHLQVFVIKCSWLLWDELLVGSWNGSCRNILHRLNVDLG